MRPGLGTQLSRPFRHHSPRPVTWEGVGIFRIEDGKILEWSDHTIRVTIPATE